MYEPARNHTTERPGIHVLYGEGDIKYLQGVAAQSLIDTISLGQNPPVPAPAGGTGWYSNLWDGAATRSHRLEYQPVPPALGWAPPTIALDERIGRWAVPTLHTRPLKFDPLHCRWEPQHSWSRHE
jgi:hypothetical protein